MGKGPEVLLRKLLESSEVLKPNRGAVFISSREGHLHLQQLLAGLVRHAC